jgi:hypothetical protein
VEVRCAMGSFEKIDGGYGVVFKAHPGTSI